MKNLFSPSFVSIRDLSEEDIPSVLNYWFHSPPGFIESMGVDLDKMPKESEMEQSIRAKLIENASQPVSKLNVVVIVYNKLPVGFHTINPLTEGESGIFHAHIWDPNYRKRGIALYSYPKACRIFMSRFNLSRILFKTPVQNIGAIRVKEKLGIRYIGEEIIGFGIIKEGTKAKVFELTRDEIENKWSTI